MGRPRPVRRFLCESISSRKVGFGTIADRRSAPLECGESTPLYVAALWANFQPVNIISPRSSQPRLTLLIRLKYQCQREHTKPCRAAAVQKGHDPSLHRTFRHFRLARLCMSHAFARAGNAGYPDFAVVRSSPDCGDGMTAMIVNLARRNSLV